MRQEIKVALNKLKDEQAKLESRITEFISNELSCFANNTGIEVSGVNIYMAQIDEIGCDPPHYIVKSVSCLIALQNKAGG